MDRIRPGLTARLCTDSAANCIELTYPETPLKISYVVRIASIMGLGESLFYGALLWVTDSTIKPSTGKGRMESDRENAAGLWRESPLQAASGHFSEMMKLLTMTTLLVPYFVFGWDAYLVSTF